MPSLGQFTKPVGTIYRGVKGTQKAMAGASKLRQSLAEAIAGSDLLRIPTAGESVMTAANTLKYAVPTTGAAALGAYAYKSASIREYVKESAIAALEATMMEKDAGFNPGKFVGGVKNVFGKARNWFGSLGNARKGVSAPVFVDDAINDISHIRNVTPGAKNVRANPSVAKGVNPAIVIPPQNTSLVPTSPIVNALTPVNALQAVTPLKPNWWQNAQNYYNRNRGVINTVGLGAATGYTTNKLLGNYTQNVVKDKLQNLTLSQRIALSLGYITNPNSLTNRL